jgi:hypothetical protein
VTLSQEQTNAGIRRDDLPHIGLWLIRNDTGILPRAAALTLVGIALWVLNRAVGGQVNQIDATRVG